MVTWGELKELHGEDNTDPHMELWVSRAAVETVVRAAVTYEVDCDGKVAKDIDNAVRVIQDAVSNAWEDSLDATPL